MNWSRREFVNGSLAAGGLVIAFFTPLGNMRLSAKTPHPNEVEKLSRPNTFLRVGEDDSVTIVLARAEMGQGVWTTLSMLVAEELDADWSRIRVENAPADPAYNHLLYGYQATGGSSSTYSEFTRQRQAGAMARALLIRAGAERFRVPIEECRTDNGVVIAGGLRATYGELARAANNLPLPTSVALKDQADWKIIGKPTKRLDSHDKVTGSAKFGLDVHFDGLFTAVVLRSPIFGGSVKSCDASEAKSIPGVRDIVQVPTGVAIIADHYWAAKCGREALRVEWNPGPNSSLDSEKMRDEFRRLAATEGAVAVVSGNVSQALKTARRVVDAEYNVPYLAHAPIEPLNCVVRIESDRCEIWAGTQGQGADRLVASKITGLPLERVFINTQFLGGGFGHRTDFDSHLVAEAVQVAKAAKRPVKTVWTREDDMRGGYYRPAYLHRVRIGVNEEGWPIAWQHSVVGQSILTGSLLEAYFVKNGVDGTSVEGLADSPYMTQIQNHRVELHTPKIGIPVNPWRSVGHSHNAFVVETLVDECAVLAGKDPVEYRQHLLKNSPRSLDVLRLAAEKAHWGTPVLPGRARGVAVHASFGSYVAQVAEVEIEEGNICVRRVVCAIDCGLAVNPAGVHAQMESGIVFGLSAALHGKLTLKGGRIQESNFHDYRVLRMNEMPVIESHIVASTGTMGGVGEVGVPPVAPAVANAVAALTGKRLRAMPFVLPV
jgi:isoquinoline 1-oxidoreductase subunit beta